MLTLEQSLVVKKGIILRFAKKLLLEMINLKKVPSQTLTKGDPQQSLSSTLNSLALKKKS